MAVARQPGTETAKAPRRDRRHLRHEETRREILDSAWKMVRAEGLAALSLSALARQVGMEPQSLYTYFASKHAIYDAMFAEGNRELLARLDAITWPAEARGILRLSAQTFITFATEDPARSQLLFSRTIPGFEPSPASYALAVEVFEQGRARLRAAGVTDDGLFDLWTALVSGLANQQMANDPGGKRWTRLIDDAVTMYAEHALGHPPSRRSRQA